MIDIQTLKKMYEYQKETMGLNINYDVIDYVAELEKQNEELIEHLTKIYNAYVYSENTAVYTVSSIFKIKDLIEEIVQ